MKKLYSRAVTRCQISNTNKLESLIFLGYLPPVNTLRKIGSTTLSRIFSNFNRWFFKREMRMFPNPAGITDKNIYTLTIKKKHLDNFGWITICFSIIYFGGHLIVALAK